MVPDDVDVDALRNNNGDDAVPGRALVRAARGKRLAAVRSKDMTKRF